MINQNWIKAYVVQIFPLLALFVYIIGFAYYIVYYHQFNINITSYITLSEVLVSTLTPILLVTALSAFCGIILFFFRSSLKMTFRDVRRVKRWLKGNAIVKKILALLQLLKCNFKLKNRKIKIENTFFSKINCLLCIPILIVIVSIVIPYCMYIDIIAVQHKYVWIILLILFSFSFVRSYRIAYKKINSDLVKNYCNISSVAIIIVSILTCMILLGIYNAEQDKKDGKLKFRITALNKYEYTDLNYVYIGECNSAVFLYNKKDKSTLVLNTVGLAEVVYYDQKDNIYTKVIDDISRLNKELEENQSGSNR